MSHFTLDFSGYKMKSFLLFFSLAVAFRAWPVSASWFGSAKPFWNGLRTTFSADGLVSWVPGYHSTGYAPVPRTVSDAKSQNWAAISGATCDNGGSFSGFRYIFMKNSTYNDTSVSALYDVNGFIAGIQMNILISQAKSDPNNTYQFDSIPMFQKNTINGNDVYTLTAYFVDPSTICTTGRSSSNFSSSGTGTQLNFQNGTSPSTLINAPMNRSVALTQGWSNNECFPGMGVHNWYKQEQFQDTECNYILPVFLLYTKQNQLIGFGFHFIGQIFSPRYEQPSVSAVKIIVGPSVSKCLVEKSTSPGVTTMHVFLIDNPMSQTCIL